MKNKLRLFLSSCFAGVAICLGAVANLSCESKIAGAVFFSVGLFIVLVFSYSLYTGFIPYVTEKDRGGILSAFVILAGNAVGSFLSGSLIGYTRLESVVDKAKTAVAVKTGDSLLSIFILAVMCNLLIYYAVHCYKNNEHEFAKYLGILLCIPVFILSSYEHCVADMCYMAIGRVYSAKAFVMLLVSVLGNTVGGILVHLVTKVIKTKAA